MSRDALNGAHLTLGLIGLAAGAAALRGRRATSYGTGRGGSFARLPHDSTCACCGTRVGSFAKNETIDEHVGGLLFVRGSGPKGLRYRRVSDGYIVYEVLRGAKSLSPLISPLYRQRAAPSGTLETDPTEYGVKPMQGSSLVRARFDTRNAFVVPYDPKMNEKYKIFVKERLAEFAVMTDRQRRSAVERVDKAIFDCGIGDYQGIGQPLAPISSEAYACQKAKLRTKSGEKVDEFEYERRYKINFLEYYGKIYVDRLWTLHLLEIYRVLSPSRRVPVRSASKSEASLFDGLDLRFVIPGPIPDSAFAPGSDVIPANRSKVVVHQRVSSAEDEIQAKQEEEVESEAALAAGIDDVEGSVRGGPQLHFYRNGKRQMIFFVANAGSQYFNAGLSRISLLTATSKMASPSFGLPAGAVKQEGGTCPARFVGERFTADSGENAPGRREAICDACYALGANYGYANNMISQEGRRVWISRFSDERSMAYGLALMVASYAMHVSTGKRLSQEIGVWDDSNGGAIVVPRGDSFVPVEPTSLRLVLDRLVMRKVQIDSLHIPDDLSQAGSPAQDRSDFKTRILQALKTPESVKAEAALSKVNDTTDWFRLLGLEKGQICGFFRLHDSGDFGVQGPYRKAWARVVRALPGVQFWAPTRLWAKMVSKDAMSQPQIFFHDNFMNEYGPQDPNVQKTYRLRSIKGSASVSPQIKKQQPEPVPAAVSPGEAGTQIPSIDESLGRRVVEDMAAIQSFQSLADLPNAAIRPSGLYITDPELRPGVELKPGQRPSENDLISTRKSSNIPRVRGFSAGTGVVRALRGAYPRVYDMSGIEAYACPVYTTTFEVRDPKTGEKKLKEAKSCRDASCRACWLAQDLPIFYGAH